MKKPKRKPQHSHPQLKGNASSNLVKPFQTPGVLGIVSRTPIARTTSPILSLVDKDEITIDKDEITSQFRTEIWLKERIELIWRHHFADVPRKSAIISSFGIIAKNRFGSIALRNGVSVIRLNRLFADPELPLFFLDETLAHELVHYVHGFGSTLPRIYADPHRGGVIELELERRGLTPLHLRAEEWRKLHWAEFYQKKCPESTLIKQFKTEASHKIWDAYLNRAGFRKLEDIQARLEEIAPIFGFADAPPFELEWNYASTRLTGMSYFYPKEEIVRIHGLLASPTVPDCVLDFELAYWVAREMVGGGWKSIECVLNAASFEETTQHAFAWRSTYWNGFRTRNHPLRG